MEKSINKLKVNDYVLSFNVNTQKYEYKKVKRVLDNGEKELLLLVLENGQRLICTPDHKLYTSKGYVEAKHETDVLTKDGFSSIVFMKNEITEEVYDIEVEDNHNFCIKDKNSDKINEEEIKNERKNNICMGASSTCKKSRKTKIIRLYK